MERHKEVDGWGRTGEIGLWLWEMSTVVPVVGRCEAENGLSEGKGNEVGNKREINSRGALC